MYTTLDHVKKMNYRNPTLVFSLFFREVKIIIVVFCLFYLGNTVFANFSLFRESALDMVLGNDRNTVVVEGLISQAATSSSASFPVPVHSSANTVSQPSTSVSDLFLIEKAKISNVLTDVHTTVDRDFRGDYVLGDDLRGRLSDYNQGFSTLPPQNRIIIQSLGINAPIIVPTLSKPLAEINEGEFDAELYQGVVKYPTTAIPGSVGGNTLLFGHTSYEERKHNPYATVFRAIPKLSPGDVITVIWEGRTVSYRIVAKKVVPPKQVNDFFLEYQKSDKHYLTIMGCYPVGTSQKRLMVVAEKI